MITFALVVIGVYAALILLYGLSHDIARLLTRTNTRRLRRQFEEWQEIESWWLLPTREPRR